MRHLIGLIYLVVYSLTSSAQAVDNFNILDNTQATISGGSISGISPPIPVASGGTGAATLTGIVKGNGTSAMTAVTAPVGALVGTTDTQSLSGKTFDTLSASGTTAGILVNRTSGNTVNSTLQYGGTDYIGYGYDGTDNFLWGYSANDVKLGARGAERLRLTSTGATVTGNLDNTGTTTKLSNQTGADATVQIGGDTPVATRSGRLGFITSSTQKNWYIANNWNIAGGLEFTQTTATGGSTMSGTPAMVLSSGGNLSVYAGGSANKVICWKSDGRTLGYCSTVVAADGSCTCN